MRDLQQKWCVVVGLSGVTGFLKEVLEIMEI